MCTPLQSRMKVFEKIPGNEAIVNKIVTFINLFIDIDKVALFGVTRNCRLIGAQDSISALKMVVGILVK